MSREYAEPLQQVDRTYVLWRGKKLSYFAGCDYFRLSSHPEVLSAVRTSLDTYGLNVAASRKTTGNHRLYIELESVIRKFFKAEAVVVSSTGYFTNIIAAQGLRSTIDHVYLDERAHGSLRDAAVILGCDVTEFRHRDPADLKEKLRRGGRRIAVLTDGMFSHSGAIAPVEEYRAVIGQSALLWVDDAHAGGVWGDGRGSVEAAGISRRNTLQTVTFSKAFGTYGGAILCSENVARKISERSAAVGGNTPMPLPLAGGTIKSLELCDKELREKLRGNIAEFWRGVGQPPPQVLSPIVSFSPRDPDSLRRKLVAARIYPPLIHYPGGPAKGYFRFAISSEHSAAQITMLAEVLAAYASTLMR